MVLLRVAYGSVLRSEGQRSRTQGNTTQCSADQSWQ